MANRLFLNGNFFSFLFHCELIPCYDTRLVAYCNELHPTSYGHVEGKRSTDHIENYLAKKPFIKNNK